ncbi:hypothetical protein HYC85_005826 [Camellia sinensis]|uniref:Uncharacterized protein n=1 Tax=Camellia sinensis TaxID=4442 RepID=A0A7J7I233_CAMSI|nr:hypothetical protein HYC85_005826 [Camellia sinensis]
MRVHTSIYQSKLAGPIETYSLVEFAIANTNGVITKIARSESDVLQRSESIQFLPEALSLCRRLSRQRQSQHDEAAAAAAAAAKNAHRYRRRWKSRSIFGDKSVGEVRVPLKDVINREEEEEEEVESSNGIIRFVSYEVRTSDGKPNGVLNFSYKVLNECNGSSSPEKKKKKNAHIDSYPILNHVNHHHSHNHNHNHLHYPSLLPDDYLQIPSGSGSGQSQESYYSTTAVDAPPPHRVHYPSLEIPYPPPPPPPPPTEEDYRMNYPQPHDQLHFHYPPPPPPPPPLISHPPFPPPHLRLHLPPHAVQRAIVYYPQLYEHPYPN